MYLDKVKNNNLWKEAMEHEMNQINNYKHLGERKCRLVEGGNWMDPPNEDIYLGIMSMNTIHVSFQLAQLNGLRLCAADIGNAFLYWKTMEKVYIRAGPEFGELQGQLLIIDKGLYGCKPVVLASISILEQSCA